MFILSMRAGLRDYEGAILAVRGKDTVESYQMNSGSGNKRSQATKEGGRAEDNMSGSILIGSFKFINDLTLDINEESLFTETGP